MFGSQTRQKMKEAQQCLNSLERALDIALRKDRSDRDYNLAEDVQKLALYGQSLVHHLTVILTDPRIYNSASQRAQNIGVTVESELMNISYTLKLMTEMTSGTSLNEIEEKSKSLTNIIKEIKDMLA